MGKGPKEAFSIDLGESIRSLECGRVSSDEHPEVVACTYCGRVCSLTTQALDQVSMCCCCSWISPAQTSDKAVSHRAARTINSIRVWCSMEHELGE